MHIAGYSYSYAPIAIMYGTIDEYEKTVHERTFNSSMRV